MNLFPRDEAFFAFLERQADGIANAARALREGIAGPPEEMPLNAGIIRQLEHEADEIAHQILTRLHKTFVTPIDPEDLQAITTAMDDVIDAIEDSSFRLVSYRIGPMPAGMTEFSETIEAACAHLRLAIRNLRGGKSFEAECIEINRLENSADDLQRRLVTDLFDSGADAVTVMKQKEIYDFLELAMDRCEDAADVLQTIAVKNS